MTIALAVVCVGLAVALVVVVRTLTDAHSAAEAAWSAERRELLERIQRPEQLPLLERGAFTIPELPDDEWSRVGTIVNDPEAYLGGEESA